MPRATNPLKAFGNFFEQSRALVALFDAEQKLIYLNPAAIAFLGCDAADVVGQTAANAEIATISPPPDAFAGKFCTGSIIVREGNGTSGTHAIFLPWGDAAQDEFAVLMIAGHEEILVHEMLQSQGSERNWHGVMQKLQLQLPSEIRHAHFLGNSPAIRRVREQLQLAGSTQVSTLIVSPTAKGGEQVVRSIQALRKIPDVNLLTVDCALHDATTFSALFRSYFPIQENGVIWLKEIDRLARPIQEALLERMRFSFKPTFLVTSTRPLSYAVRKHGFSAELAAELSTLTIKIPPFKSRLQDIPLLGQWCVEQHNATATRALSGLLPAALEHLAAYDWPGDVDEFVELVTLACTNAKGLWVTPADLPERLRTAWDNLVHPRREETPIQLDAFLAEMETEILRRALKQSRGNKSKAAQLLGISRPRLLRRLVQLGIVAAEEEKIDFQPLDEGEAP